jgi:TetR/AcrR family transcriptional regulator
MLETRPYARSMVSDGRIGRPRIQPRSRAGDPSDEILAAASRLFGERGVTGTTMSQIASGAGLQQSSLYYYFRSKQEILAALVAKANVVPLELVRQVRGEARPPAARLYRFVRGDVLALCQLPFDINEVHRYAARDRDRFATYWKERRTLQSSLTAIIQEGIDDRSLRAVPPRLAALTLMSNDEAVQNWFRHDAKPLRDPAAIGAAIAEMSVAGLLADPGAIAAVIAAADDRTA